MAWFSRSQSGTKLLRRGTGDNRAVPVGAGAVCRRRLGRRAGEARPVFAACRYLPAFTLSDVLPLPKTSIARPTRGVMSLYESTPLVSGKLIAVGRNRSGPTVTAGK